MLNGQLLFSLYFLKYVYIFGFMLNSSDHVLFIVYLMKCHFLSISCFSVLLLIFDTFPKKYLNIFPICCFLFRICRFLNTKTNREKSGDFRTHWICRDNCTIIILFHKEKKAILPWSKYSSGNSEKPRFGSISCETYREVLES